MSDSEAAGRILAGILFSVVMLMLFSMLFSLAWNTVVTPRFGLHPLNSLDSLCLLSCIFIAGRTAGLGRSK